MMGNDHGLVGPSGICRGGWRPLRPERRDGQSRWEGLRAATATRLALPEAATPNRKRRLVQTVQGDSSCSGSVPHTTSRTTRGLIREGCKDNSEATSGITDVERRDFP